MALFLHNTLTRSRQRFEPADPGRVTMYVCGPTVYDLPHLGHGRFTLVWDTLRRWLTFLGLDVTFVSNITDIDDNIIARAQRESRTEADVAREFEDRWWDAMEKIGVARPTHTPHATEYVEGMVNLIEGFLSKGIAYQTRDGVYLDISQVPDYGALAGQSLDSLRAGARVEAHDEKRSPLDFALWKNAKPGEPTWPASFGDGRPGWHTECVVMSLALLGEGFDLHCGGLDLKFPHHENERAQAEAAGKDFARHWAHNGFVMVGDEKMSKSLGNSLQVKEILKKVRGIELRWYLGSAHYRSMLEFSFEALEESAIAFRRIEAFLSRATELLKKEPEAKFSAEFKTAMDNDLAVPEAIATISESMKQGNNAISSNDLKSLEKYASEVRGALAILGCDPFDSVFKSGAAAKKEVLDGLVALALEQRTAARDRKDFATSDAIRDELAKLGVVIEDTAQGVRWSIN